MQAINPQLVAPSSSIWSAEGRVGRAHYFWTTLIIATIGALVTKFAELTDGGGAIFALLLLLPLVWVSLVVAIKRCHDIGQSGWLCLLSLVPLVNFGFGLYLLLRRGTQHANRYGPQMSTTASGQSVGTTPSSPASAESGRPSAEPAMSPLPAPADQAPLRAGSDEELWARVLARETPRQLQTVASSEEGMWAIAAEEVDGPTRRIGLWAKAFAEAQGNEAAAKVSYLKWRVEQLQAQHGETVRQEQAEEAARRAQQLGDQTARQRAIEQQASAKAAEDEAYRRAVRELDTSPEGALQAFVAAVPHEHAAYVFSLKNDVGGTLLHTAAREGFAALAEALLTKGADPSLAGPKGLLAHQVAARNGHVQLAQRLKQSLDAGRSAHGEA